MPRKNPTLLSDVSAVQPVGSTQWIPTHGYLNSVDAVLAPGATSATVDVYVANNQHGRGKLIASLSMTAAEPTEAFSLSRDDSAWHFVRAEVSALAGGNVRSVTASVGE
jgi:hypothetical protein